VTDAAVVTSNPAALMSTSARNCRATPT
jgi:hypothetical protein